MKKRKVAFLHVSFPDGGAERITMDIINYIPVGGINSLKNVRK